MYCSLEREITFLSMFGWIDSPSSRTYMYQRWHKVAAKHGDITHHFFVWHASIVSHLAEKWFLLLHKSPCVCTCRDILFPRLPDRAGLLWKWTVVLVVDSYLLPLPKEAIYEKKFSCNFLKDICMIFATIWYSNFVPSLIIPRFGKDLQ